MLIDLTGKVFNKLTVIEYSKTVNHRVYWKCVCSCGKEKLVLGTSLKSGHTKSCGCSNIKTRSDAWKKHGCSHGANMSKEQRSTYGSWQSIKSRCCYENGETFKRYGAIGITMCDRWVNSFQNFLEDMGVKPTIYHSIDRYPDKKGNYEPNNCRWATRAEQNRNLSTNTWLEYNGVKLIQTDWAKVLGISQCNLSDKLKNKRFEDIVNYFINKKKINICNGQISSAGVLQ